MRTGRRLAIDVGKVRVGVAISDPHGIVASPLVTLQREELQTSLEPLLNCVIDFDNLLEIYVGLPVNMKGEITASTEDALAMALQIQSDTTVPVRLIDERLTTSLASSQLRSLGKSQKDARSTIDRMAAVAILEYAFQVEVNTGTTPGKAVNEWRAENE